MFCQVKFTKEKLQITRHVETKAFRFTLGIPGFDDALVPRIIGFVGIGLIIGNHLQSAESIPPPQFRSEAVGLALSLACIATPTVDKRLKELNISIGRRLSSDKTGVDQCFLLDPELPEQLKQEIAWTSYALLKCTNVCTVVLTRLGEVIAVRGWIKENLVTELEAEESLRSITKGTLTDLLKVGEESVQTYVPNLEALPEMKLALESIQPYSSALCIQPILSSLDRTPPIGNLIMISDRAASFSTKDRTWIQSLAQKLESEFQF